MSTLSLLIVAAIIGLFAGGVVNLFVLRTREGLRFSGRRACVVCAEPHGAADLIPVWSFLRLKGRCRRCAAALPWQYPLVEVAFALLFAVFAWQAVHIYG